MNFYINYIVVNDFLAKMITVCVNYDRFFNKCLALSLLTFLFFCPSELQLLIEDRSFSRML